MGPKKKLIVSPRKGGEKTSRGRKKRDILVTRTPPRENGGKGSIKSVGEELTPWRKKKHRRKKHPPPYHVGAEKSHLEKNLMIIKIYRGKGGGEKTWEGRAGPSDAVQTEKGKGGDDDTRSQERAGSRGGGGILIRHQEGREGLER